MSDENGTTTKGMADPLPLLPFTYCNLYGSKQYSINGDDGGKIW